MTDMSLALTGAKAAFQMATGMAKLNTMLEVQSKSIELTQKIIDIQQHILEAQQTESALVDRVRDMEGEIKRLKDWSANKSRYELAQPFKACMVYALKKDQSNGQIAHYLCATCFNLGKPSILQSKQGEPSKSGIGLVHSIFYCPSCKTEAHTRYRHASAPQYFEDIQTAD